MARSTFVLVYGINVVLVATVGTKAAAAKIVDDGLADSDDSCVKTDVNCDMSVVTTAIHLLIYGAHEDITR